MAILILNSFTQEILAENLRINSEVLQQRDNFRIGQRKNFRIGQNRIRFSLAAHREEDLDGQGSYHHEQERD